MESAVETSKGVTSGGSVARPLQARSAHSQTLVGMARQSGFDTMEYRTENAYPCMARAGTGTIRVKHGWGYANERAQRMVDASWSREQHPHIGMCAQRDQLIFVSNETA